MKKVNLLVLAILTLGCMLTSCRKQNMIAETDGQQAAQEQLSNGISGIGAEKPCLGKPQPDCLCPDVYEPVCGCDGVTYSNSCAAFCAGVLQYKPNPCGCLGTPQRYCVCPDVYAPVCGCNGVTYSNSCEADCAGVLIYTQGGCNGEGRTAFGILQPR